MPRPTVINAKRQPAPPLNVEELKFWLRILEEHALFISAGLPCDNAGLINETETFQQEFAALQAQAEAVINERRFAELVAEARAVAEDFYRFNRRLVHLALTCQVLGCNFALLLDHMSREAEYVVQLLDKLEVGQAPLFQVSSAREAAFWLRIMADHAEFIVHRLDPSERNLINTACEFAEEFDELYLQGRDFVSMLRGEEEEIPSFRRFLQDSRAAVARLRDFTKAAEILIGECKLVGLIPAVLADHMRREADHFLLVLALLEKTVYVPFDEEGELEYLEVEETLAAKTAAGAPPAHCVKPGPAKPITAPGGNIYYEDAGGAVNQEQAREPQEFVAAEEELSPLPAEESEQPADEPPPEPQPKFKWSGKWPRPLGSKAK